MNLINNMVSNASETKQKFRKRPRPFSNDNDECSDSLNRISNECGTKKKKFLK